MVLPAKKISIDKYYEFEQPSNKTYIQAADDNYFVLYMILSVFMMVLLWQLKRVLAHF